MKKLLLKNTLTNYMVVIVRALQGILVTRWMIEFLGQGGYGLWSLLWVIFAYALLLDFGFGISVLKYTSNQLYKKDLNKYNAAVSTVFSFHSIMAVLIVVATVILSFWTEELFNISEPDKVDYCRKCLLFFGCGTALVFPTGMFAEILIGLHKMYLRNYVNTVIKIIELAATLVILMIGGRVLAMIFLVVGLMLAGNLCMAFLVPRRIPGFRISLRLDLKVCREVASFSGFAFLISMAGLILRKSSYLVISISSGLQAVGIYQISGRLAELCKIAGAQYHENVRPVTGMLVAQGEKKKLSRFILQSMRYNCLFGLFFILPAFIFTEEALLTLFNVDDQAIIYLSRLFLVATFVTLAIRQTVNSFLIMAEKHRFISGVVIFEAALNLLLNILLIERFGVECVLWNGMGINLVLAVFLSFPKAFSILNLSFFTVLWQVYLRPSLVAVPGVALGVLFKTYCKGYVGNFLTVAIGSIITSGVFLILAFFLALKKEERLQLFGVFLYLKHRRAEESDEEKEEVKSETTELEEYLRHTDTTTELDLL